MSELEQLIADQQRDADNYRARDVFDVQGASHRLLVGGEGGIARVVSPRRSHYTYKHGTLYRYKRGRCRCSECRRANADWQRAYRQRLSLEAV